jgi:hypothetical protein
VNRAEIRLPIRFFALAGRVGLLGLIALLAAALSGCGAGQISQTAMQEPAINGNRVTITNASSRSSVDLRDIRIQAAQTGDWIEKGRTVDLVLVAVNQSQDVPDRLVSITSDIGTVNISGDPRLAPGGMLFVGAPEGQRVAPGPMQGTNAVKASVTLNDKITNGLTYRFTFNFEKAGQSIPVLVPISAGLAPERAA